MKSILLSLGCFFAAITAHAQAKWTAIMTQGTAAQAYNSFTTLSGLEEFIKEQAKKDNVVSEVVYGDGKWYAVATYSSVQTSISWNWDARFPSDWVSTKWKEGKYITKLTHGDDNWLVIMTNQTPYVNQSWAKRDTWDEIEKFAKDKWKENSKYNITDIAYGNGVWYVVMSELKEYEAQTFKVSETFPNDWIETKYNDKYNITSIENDGEKWYIVMTKQTANKGETIFNPQSDFPEKKIKDQWDKNRRISSLAYIKNSEEEDDDWAAAFLAQQAKEQDKTNREKAAEKLYDQDYPAAIRYYKAAIAEGNAEELLYNNLAWAQYLNGNCADGLENVNKAISMKSTSYNNHTKASILKCQNKCAEAIRFYDEAIRLYRKEHDKFTDSEYYADRAEAKRCVGNYVSAIDDIELAITIEPNKSKLKTTLKELNQLAGNK